MRKDATMTSVQSERGGAGEERKETRGTYALLWLTDL